jgi:hypothetical protein
MLTPEELAQTYAAAWLEKDPTARRELLERCCRPDVRFLQEGWEEIVGIDQLEKTIADFQASWPAGGKVDVQITTPVQEHHGYGRGGFVWIFRGDERVYGTDFVEVRDGKLQTIVVFGDPGPPATP